MPDSLAEGTVDVDPGVEADVDARSGIDLEERPPELAASDASAPRGAHAAAGRRSAPWAAPVSAVVLGVVVAGAALYGVLLRVWLLVHLPLWGDEAIVGLMAKSIDNGHFSAFYWGQHYGGLEPYLVAAALRVGGGGEPALNGTPAVLAALAAVLVACVALAAGRDRLTAAAAGAAVWVWPFVVVWQSVREGGFREATLCCGLAAVVCCIRASRGRAGPWTFVVLGVALGLGWWASPEIVYFAPACLVLVWGWVRSPSRRWSSVPLALVGFGVGSLPWWYVNAGSGFISLQSSALPNNGGVTFSTKLSVFFHQMLPLQLGLKTIITGSWIGGTSVGVFLYVVALVVIAAAVVWAVVVFLRDHSRLAPLALALSVVCYPFLYAAFPGTGYWLDGRYGIYFPALLVALLATMPLRAPGRRPEPARGAHARSGSGDDDERDPAPVTARPRTRVVAALALAGAVCLTVAGAHDDGIPASGTFFSGWHNGDASMEQVVSALRAHHITDAYGTYWTAYDLDFLSDGHPTISPSPIDVRRAASIGATVDHSKDPAWLFFAPDQAAPDSVVFGNPQPGPGPYTEQSFEAFLTKLGIHYTVVPLGILDAVVPAQRVPT